ncbi:MAG: ATP-binding cassette domain-containing protein [Ignavibacteriae bacterium]|nr:ATP-binding cassette domain-containing protein [Ignavibacteriota bacterium]
MIEYILNIENLSVKYTAHNRLFSSANKYINAVESLDLSIIKGETLGLVGESGCGKTTIVKAVAKLLRSSAPEAVVTGKAIFDADGQKIDLLSLSEKQFRKHRELIQVIFQDPYSSLNPRFTAGQIIEEPLYYFTKLNKAERKKEVGRLMEITGLKADFASRYPYEFSAGQRQRIGIARALAPKPKLIIADEPVSSLDVSVQAQILNLLEELKSDFGLSMIFVSHDLSVIEHISDRTAVMYLGRIVETGSSANIYKNPLHPYTKALLSAVPVINRKKKKEKIVLEGENPSAVKTGCAFYPRCPVSQPLCESSIPQLEEKLKGHSAACHFCAGGAPATPVIHK